MQPLMTTSHHIQRAALALAWALSSGCSSCERDDEAPGPTASAKTAVSAAPVASESAPAVVERRSLIRRESLDSTALIAQRAASLDQLAAARKALEDGNAAEALTTLEPLVARQPLCPVLRLFESRAALALGDAARAQRAARLSVYGATGRTDLVTDALLALGAALEKLQQTPYALEAFERAAAESPRSKAAKDALARVQQTLGQAGPVKADTGLRVIEPPSSAAACSAIENDLRSGRVLATDPEKLGTVVCAPDATLDLGVGGIVRSVAFRVDIPSEPAQRLIYVGVERDAGFSVIGPVAVVYGANDPAVVNDVMADLQRIDVLRGGAPEVVVKISERHTVPAVVLNEVLEVDQTRVVLLSIDRGKLEPSRELMLDQRVLRSALAEGETKMPKGFSRAQNLGKPSEYRMKVAWSGPNAITLTRASGAATPRDEGAITLFPE
jgi:tetratricopeptide (TPR) repeat protein